MVFSFPSSSFVFHLLVVAAEAGVLFWGVGLIAWVEEETLLIGFFGMDYVRYRDRTRVGIPFIT